MDALGVTAFLALITLHLIVVLRLWSRIDAMAGEITDLKLCIKWLQEHPTIDPPRSPPIADWADPDDWWKHGFTPPWEVQP